MPPAQSRFWCWTLNNPTDAELLAITNCAPGPGRNSPTYIVYGRERGESGTPHLQGYVEFRRVKRFGAVKRLLGDRVHLESRSRFATAEQAATYCKKDGDFTELGEISVPRQGARSDLAAIRSEIEEGKTELELAQEHFSAWVFHRRSFERYRQLLRPNGIRPELRVIVLWGQPGTGKTRYCYDTAPDLYSCPDSQLRWFDGYAGQSTVLIDDYRGAADESFLLKLLDIYPLQVAVKGGFVPWNPSLIFITSNLQVPFNHEAIEAPLRRRLHCVVEVLTRMDNDDIARELVA